MNTQNLNQVEQNNNIFKPSLVSRIINEEFSNKVYLNNELEDKPFLFGGSSEKEIIKSDNINIHDNINTNIGKRIFIHIFILFIALFLSVIITSIEPIHNAIFKENSLDNNDTIFKKRYIQILIFTSIFILFTIVILILLYSLLYIFIGLYVSATNQQNDYLFPLINKTFKNAFWNFDNGNMKIYFNILLFTLIILFIGYLIYFAIVKDYLNNIWFGNYITNDNDEHSLSKKYLINYAFIVFNMTLFLVLFSFIIAYLFPDSLNLLSLTDISIRLFYYILVISLFSVFAGLVFFSYLRKDLKKLIIYFSIFFIISILSIFATSFFSNI